MRAPTLLDDSARAPCRGGSIRSRPGPMVHQATRGRACTSAVTAPRAQSAAGRRPTTTTSTSTPRGRCSPSGRQLFTQRLVAETRQQERSDANRISASERETSMSPNATGGTQVTSVQHARPYHPEPPKARCVGEALIRRIQLERAADVHAGENESRCGEFVLLKEIPRTAPEDESLVCARMGAGE